KRGMIRARETVRAGRRPERTIYEITDAGAREATYWLSDLLSIPGKEFPSFMAALSFLPALPPDDVVAALRPRVNALDMKLLKMAGVGRAAEQAGLPRLFAIESEYEAAMLQAELDFARKLLEDIDSGSLDGLKMWEGFHAETSPDGEDDRLDDQEAQ